jgi:DNA repair exonuclease SbcCD ATPase subunit
MKLTRLKIQNFLGVEASDEDFDGAPVVAFRGRNGSGKTSRLAAIQALFTGGKSVPEIPIKRGAKKAMLVGETDTLICTRTFTKSGTKLEVRPKAEGAVKMTRPQQVLDELIGPFLDPMAFDAMDAKKRASTLRQLVGLDLSRLDETRSRYEQERRDVGRDLKRAKGALEKLGPEPEGDADGMTVAEILTEIQAREQRNDDRNSQRAKLADMKARGQALIGERKTREERIRALEAELGELSKRQADSWSDLERLRVDGQKLAAEVDALPPDEPIDDLKAKLEDAEKVAAAAAQSERRSELGDEVDGLQSQYDTFTSKIGELDQTRTDAIAGAQYPVEGLEARDDGVYLDGVPWDQANASRRIVASTAMGFALHPELKIICVQNASLLDDQSLHEMRRVAMECGGQAFLEIVGDNEDVVVVIDGGGRESEN